MTCLLNLFSIFEGDRTMKFPTQLPIRLIPIVLLAFIGCSTTQAEQKPEPRPIASPIASPMTSPIASPMTSPIAEKPDRPLNTVTLSPKTATFTWRKPDSDPKSTNRSDRREANLRYPIVTGVENPELQSKIQASIDLKSAFGKSLQEMEAEYQENYWMENLDYKVNFNDRGLLSLTYIGYGVGAYPSEFVRYRSVNLRTGAILRPHDLFKTEALGAIALIVDRQLQQAIQTKVAELDKDENAKDIDRAIFRAHRFRIKHLNDFTLTSEGIVFHYRFGFPHVILAAEPQSDYLIPYAQLKSQFKPNSPLLEIAIENPTKNGF